ncbi:E3 ubiquitin-protein ligase TRAIP [Frankliniella fusca]|uniref:E3 ubiquitin-protein ligase TRAIP n=1 Tax=Frankliniella fusca TaxID=407009 RepID=A0AAE1H7I2_9NEOP|nr:E3 ubiquitin-protein ligase TRAIP [Frankliniella fusca]
MRLTCIVCRELLLPSEEVNVAPCGHFFHYTCWIGWLERSKTCPQCRKKTTEKQIFRLFFNLAEGEGEEIEDAAAVNNKLDSLAFNLRLKEKDLSNAKELLEKETNVNEGLRTEIKRYKKRMDEADTQRQCLESKISYLRMQAKETEQAKAQVESLKTKLDRLQRMDTIIHGNVSDVEAVLDTTKFTPEGMRSLALFTASLKKALEESKERREQLREAHNADKCEMRKLNQEVRELKMKLEMANTAKEHLESDVQHLEQEKKSLNEKIQALERAVLSPSADNIRDNALRRLIAESPAPEYLKRMREEDENAEDVSNLTPVQIGPGRSVFFSQSDTENMPSQQAKQLDLDGSPALGVKPLIVKGSTVPLKKTQSMPVNSTLNKMSIFNKRFQPGKQSAPLRPTSQFGAGYDGLGGHSHPDEFPIPSPKPFKKAKQAPTAALSKSKKLSAPAGVPKLDQFSGFLSLDD